MKTPMLAVAITGLLLACRTTPGELKTQPASTRPGDPVAITMGVGGVT